MAVSKLSQIASAPGAPALTDTVVGVGGGTTDYQYTYGQIASTIGLTKLTGDTTYFVRTVPVVVSISNASPAVATCAGGHGFQIGDQVVFSTPLDRGICTISVASPGVITYANHGFSAGDPVSFDWSGGQLGVVGALPNGLTAGAAPPSVSPLYYVTNNGALTTNTFNVSDTQAHALAGTNTVNTTAPTGSIAITSGTYVSGTGVITLALPSLNFSVGDPVILTNLTGTGAFASLVGTWTVLTVTGTTAATLQGPVGAGTAAITGGTAMVGTNYVQRWSTMPSSLDSSVTYYVIAAGFSSTAFQFSTSSGGAAVNTTTTQIGKVTAQTGNDLNNGLAQTRTGAFLTVQAAINALNGVNIGTNQVTLQLADGTYAIPSTKAPIDFSKLSPLPPSTLGRPAFIKIRGNGNNQDQVVVRASGGNIGCFLETAGPAPGYFLRMDFIRLYHTDNGESCVKVADKTPETNNYIQLFGITFVNGFEKLVAVGQCLIDYLQSNFYFVGNAGDSIIHLSDGAQARLNYGTTFTAIGTVNSPNAFLVMGDGQFPRASGLINGGAFFFGNYTGLVWNIGNEARINEYLSSLVSGGTSSTATGIQGIASLTQPGTMFGGGVNTYYSSVDLVPYRGLNFISGAVADFLYNYQQPSTGASITLDNLQGEVIIDPSGTLSTLTFVMPPTPQDGQKVKIRTSHIVSTLTVSPNSGQSVVGAPSSLAVGQVTEAIYRAANTTWYF